MRSSTIAVELVRLWAPDNLRLVAPGVALRLDALWTIVAFTVCDECGAVVSALPAHTAEARSLICHPAPIIAEEG